MDGNPLLDISRKSMGFLLILISLLFVSSAYGYDPLDPNGNITIKWDVLHDNVGTQDVKVSIYNYQLFRLIEHPGWRLSWTWRGDEVIWDILGAEATEQGNCSRFKTGNLPHCCEKKPTIIDLLAGSPLNNQVPNCCKGGVLSSMTQDPDKFGAALQMHIERSADDHVIPANFTIGLAGYTCGDPFVAPPSKFIEDNGRRTTQALATWNITCSYSQFRASPAPTCCVSLSAFYNDTVVPCPKCSCSCQGQPPREKCVNGSGDLPPVLQLPPNQEIEPVVQCTHHMCPVKIHWHVKQNYREYWRVKITVTNFNYVMNYTQWTLVVLHPNLNNLTQVFSFNYKLLNQYGNINDTGMFYGIKMYNDILLQSGRSGNVQTEMLLQKDQRVFTFKDGWGFPRKISFNGQQCVMPQPDDYPRLPSSSDQFKTPFTPIIFVLSISLFHSILF